MKVNFIYDEDMDIDCLLTKGGGSNNSPGSKTKTYEALLAYTTDLGNREKVREFVRKFIRDNKLDPEKNVSILKNNWDSINSDFENRASKIFGLNIKDAITAYLTITGRFPYNIENKYFYVSAKNTNANTTAMHELWHFYTWKKFGKEMEKIGAKKYNDIKESLTVLLNIECANLMNEEIDAGYFQHQNLRKEIADVWQKTKNIEKVWEHACRNKNIAFIDGQNLYFNTAKRKINPWHIDLKRFRIYLADKYNVTTAYYFLGFVQEDNQEVYEEIQNAGFVLIFREHNAAMIGKKKGNVDSDIIFQAMKKMYKRENFDKIVIVSGDGDYKMLIDFLIEEKKFEKILFPDSRYASSLYKKLGSTYFDYLDSPDIKSKIEAKKEKGSLGS